MTWWLLWWVWLSLALILGVLEVLLPVFVFLGFSAGAVGTAILVALGLDLGLGGTVLTFAAISSVAYGALRLGLGSQGGQTRIVRRDVNDDP